MTSFEDDDWFSFTAERGETATLAVRDASGGPAPLAPDPDTDPDGDGDYEGVTGDGTFDVIDVAEFPVLFDRMPAGGRQYFGFEPDGTINVLDVAELLAGT